MKKYIILTATFLASSLALGSSLTHDYHGFISDEDAASREVTTIEEAALTGSGITKEEFMKVNDYHKEVFDKEGIIKAYGASWTIAKKWTDNTKNANASKRGSRWHINMYGGLARDKNFTSDGFALVLCHETGHLVGGFPAYKRSNGYKQMMANEGNSDYYATFACANLLWGKQDEKNKEILASADPKALKFCDDVWGTDEKGKALCVRNLEGSIGLAKFLNRDKPVHYDKPDTTKKRSTMDKHPPGQCRLDTYMAGAACKKYANWDHKKYPKDKADMAQKSCDGQYTGSPMDTMKKGFRSRCWYAP